MILPILHRSVLSYIIRLWFNLSYYLNYSVSSSWPLGQPWPSTHPPPHRPLPSAPPPPLHTHTHNFTVCFWWVCEVGCPGSEYIYSFLLWCFCFVFFLLFFFCFVFFCFFFRCGSHWCWQYWLWSISSFLIMSASYQVCMKRPFEQEKRLTTLIIFTSFFKSMRGAFPTCAWLHSLSRTSWQIERKAMVRNRYNYLTPSVPKRYKRKVLGVPKPQTAALPRHQEEEETDKTKQAQIEQTYEEHQD